jgi:membrane fusion protein (multidrug efflux system)
MADQLDNRQGPVATAERPLDTPARAQPFIRSRGFLIGVVVVFLLVAGATAWYLMTLGRETTDDAQVDAFVTAIAARVGGTVLRVPVEDNQMVQAGTVLVEIDPRDYQIAVDKAQAELADAEAAAVAAQSTVPITSTTAASNVASAQGTVEQAASGVDAAQKEVEAAQARLAASQSRVREAEANAVKASRDVDRLKGLLAKDEVSQMQFDAATAAADVQRAAVDTAKSQVAEAEVGIRVAQSKLAQTRAGEQQARANLKAAQTAPEQVIATKARASSAEARVQQAKATLAQAQLNLEYTTVKAPANGIVSKKAVNPGQVVQPNQPLLSVVQTGSVWVTANFKETQLNAMRPGQRAEIEVDAYKRTFKGHIDSIAAATGARFSLLPPENATGNFVKVVQRVPVKIVLDEGQDPEHLLRPGMSVTPTVYTK